MPDANTGGEIPPPLREWSLQAAAMECGVADYVALCAFLVLKPEDFDFDHEKRARVAYTHAEAFLKVAAKRMGVPE